MFEKHLYAEWSGDGNVIGISTGAIHGKLLYSCVADDVVLYDIHDHCSYSAAI